jgi:two-component system cell cycle response regulator DivK
MNRPHILIVDDNLMNLELVAFLLQSNGLDVESAPDACAARMRIASHEPDLLLMDVQLPDTDGLTFTRQLKSDPLTRHIPIVAFTAYAMKGDEARMREAGCDGYLSKPIDVASFTASVKSYLRVNTSANS